MCIFIVFFILFTCCNVKNINSTIDLNTLNISKWNQLTVNKLINSFRIDTTNYNQLKQPPPLSKVSTFSYPNSSKIFNNDIATIWNFLNRRNYALNIVDSIFSDCKNKLEIIEFYKFRSIITYEVSCDNDYFKIVLYPDNSKKVNEIDELSTLMSGLEDNRGVSAPIRTLTIKSTIEKNNIFIINTLYIDSSED